MTSKCGAAILALVLVGASACSFTSSTTKSPSDIHTTAASLAPIPGSAQPAGLIAFRRYTGLDLETSQIVTSRIDGSNQQILTRPDRGVRDTLPAWSYDGRRIAFMRSTPAPHATAEVDVVERSSGAITQLTHSPASSSCGGSSGPQPAAPTSDLSCNGDPAWSPDGQTLAYSHRYRRNSIERSEIWLVDATGSRSRPLIQGGSPARDSSPVWSPDGTRLAFEHVNDNGTSSIFLVRGDGTGERQLTASNLKFGDHPAWSPDGSRILFRSNPGDPTQEFHQSDLYTVRPDGTGLTKLNQSDRNVEFLSASWSPDGQWIVAGLVRRGDHHDQAQIYLLSSSATQGRLVVADPNWQSAPRWLPASGETAP